MKTRIYLHYRDLRMVFQQVHNERIVGRVSVLDHFPNLKNTIARYDRDNHINLTVYITPGTPVVAMGRAIYA